jgi:hypothetical protein
LKMALANVGSEAEAECSQKAAARQPTIQSENLEVLSMLRELLKVKSAGEHGDTNQQSSQSYGLVDPTGLIDGFKLGELGAPNTLQFLSKFPYSGMNSQPKGARNFIRRIANVNRLDFRSGDHFWPETETKGEKIMVGEVELECQGTKIGVPERVVVSTYWRDAKKEILALKGCNRDVYAPEHKAYHDFQRTASLICLRLDYLEATVTYLDTRMGKQWGVIWRYVLAFMQDRFGGATIHDLSDLDIRMLAANEQRSWDTQLNGMVADTLLYHHLIRAQEAVDSLVVRKLSAKTGNAGLAGSAGTKTRCPLCNSGAHKYKAGEYDHPPNLPITQACPRILADGEVCGQTHAFAGPLRTPCRGNLEGSFPLRRRN